MDAATTVHPTDQTLQAYGLGQLDDQVAEAVSRHLDGCPDCLRRVAGLSSDSFLGRLRQAESPNGSAAGRTTPVGPSPTGHAAPPGAPRTAGTLPAELAEHPDYEIVRELGHGGMGVVFLAHNQIMGRDEVLKVIGRDIIERPGVLDRFLREIRAVARLQHPNIVTAYSAFRAGGSLVLAMEYVEGLDLGRMVKVKGPMPVGNACSFVYQAALGLQHAHEAGMVHRDIKPGNLMLTHEGGRAAIKVLDFGLAKAGREQGMLDFSQPGEGRELNSLGDLTLAGQMLGTPDFIAPEQISDAQKADIRADIYSLGCTLYYVLSGRAPFEAATLYDILQAHHSMDARLLNFVRPEVPAELAALVAKMMAKEPHRRFQTPSEVAKALAPFFKKRTAASVSQNLGVDPVLAPVAGPAASDPTQPGPDAVAVPASAPETGPGMWTSLIKFKETQGDADAVAGEAKPARERPRWLWPAVAASVGFAAVLFGAVAVNLRAHKDRGKSGTSLPAHNITVMPDGARETIDSPEPNRRAVAANNDSLVSSGPVEKIAAENPKTDRSSMAEVKLEGVPAKAPSPDPRRETDRRKAKENLQAEPGQEIAGVEKGASGPLKLAPKKVNKSMRWADSVYILDAEDDVRQAAAAVRYEEYRRAFLDLASLKANQADRKAWVAILMQQKEALSQEEILVRATMQDLDNLSAAKREERRSLDGISPTGIVNAAKGVINDQIAAIDNEKQQCQKRVDGIRGEQQELNNRLDLLRRGAAAPAEIQKLQKSVGPRLEEYNLSLKALRECVDLVKQLYSDVADDPKVKTTITAKNQGLPRRRYELGPSPRFHDVERKLKQHENWVKATTSPGGRRGTSKAASPASRRLPPAF